MISFFVIGHQVAASVYESRSSDGGGGGEKNGQAQIISSVSIGR